VPTARDDYVRFPQAHSADDVSPASSPVGGYDFDWPRGMWTQNQAVLSQLERIYVANPSSARHTCFFRSAVGNQVLYGGQHRTAPGVLGMHAHAPVAHPLYHHETFNGAAASAAIQEVRKLLLSSVCL